jgi:hypothetical protein
MKPEAALSTPIVDGWRDLTWAILYYVHLVATIAIFFVSLVIVMKVRFEGANWTDGCRIPTRAPAHLRALLMRPAITVTLMATRPRVTSLRFLPFWLELV